MIRKECKGSQFVKNKYAVKPLSLTVINFVVAHDLLAHGSKKYM